MVCSIVKYIVEVFLIPYALGVLSGFKGNQFYEKRKKKRTTPYIESKTDSESKTISFEGTVVATENASTTISQLQTLVCTEKYKKKNK